MLTLYCTNQCDEIEEHLRSLSLAHETIQLPPASPDESIPEGVAPPALVDDGQVFEGEDEIVHHLEELAAFRSEWDEFQSDACYCDGRGEVI